MCPSLERGAELFGLMAAGWVDAGRWGLRAPSGSPIWPSVPEAQPFGMGSLTASLS